jgi:hypothetical protein
MHVVHTVYARQAMFPPDAADDTVPIEGAPNDITPVRVRITPPVMARLVRATRGGTGVNQATRTNRSTTEVGGRQARKSRPRTLVSAEDSQ